MKKLTYIISALLTLPFVSGCGEHDLPNYSGGDAIFFDQQYGVSHFDSLRQSHQIYSYIPFGVMLETDSTLRVKVEVAGKIRDYDRHFGIEVVADSTTAIAGQEYDLPSTDGVILAGQNSTYISVDIHRTPRLDTDGTLQLQLRLLPGEHFTLPFGKDGIGVMPKRAEGGSVYTELSCNFDPSIHNIFINTKLRKPSSWNNDKFGSYYSDTKYALILKITEEKLGWTVEDFEHDPDNKMLMTRCIRVAEYVSKYLMEQYRKGREYWVLDEDGSMMWVLGVSWAEGTKPEEMVE